MELCKNCKDLSKCTKEALSHRQMQIIDFYGYGGPDSDDLNDCKGAGKELVEWCQTHPGVYPHITKKVEEYSDEELTKFGIESIFDSRIVDTCEGLQSCLEEDCKPLKKYMERYELRMSGVDEFEVFWGAIMGATWFTCGVYKTPDILND